MANPNNKRFLSIRTRLLLSFVIVIIILLMSNIAFIVMHFTFVDQYEEITNRLILESKFTVMVPDLTDSYNNAINGASKSRYDRYYATRENILDSIDKLDSTITKQESKVLYSSLRKFALNMVNICDSGLNYSIDGNNVEALRIYQKDINPMKPYIVESASNLMISELDYAQGMQDDIRKTQEWIIILSIILLVMIVNLTVLFVISTSDKITKPLIKLSNLAKDISEGNLNRNVDSDLLGKNDEIGSLSNSLNEMLQRINNDLKKKK